MFHNNWIVTSEAKEYRLKELGLFYSVEDKIDITTSRPFSYYSNMTARYLTYTSLDGQATIEEEEEVLETALLTAIALDRILILPEFNCHLTEQQPQPDHDGDNDEQVEKTREEEEGKDNVDDDGNKDRVEHNQNTRCMLNHFWCIRQFDSIFKEYYREHSFLTNPQLPKVIQEEFENTPSLKMEELGFDMISFMCA